MTRIVAAALVLAVTGAVLAPLAAPWIGERWHCVWNNPEHAVCFEERAQCESDRWAEDSDCETRWRVYCIYTREGERGDCLPTSDMCNDFRRPVLEQTCRAR